MSTTRTSRSSRARPLIVMVTNHGIHEWQVNAGLPDTGGQNVYVNDLSATLAGLGFRVRIFNRGGYPHPLTGDMRTGTRRGGEHEHITYLEDSVGEFVRKEDMGGRIGELAEDLARHLTAEDSISAIISHYWDGAMVAEGARRALGLAVPHVWIPHSLGALKKERTRPEEWDRLRIEERIASEQEIVPAVDAIGSTSRAMEESLARDYGREDTAFLPPCVDTGRFDRESARGDRRALGLLAERTGRRESEVADARLVTEISRTDTTKRKDILIRAFARVYRQRPDTLLAVTIDRSREDLYAELTALITELDLEGAVAVLGSVWEYVPSLYGLSAVYCTASIMEGFGMSIQEAAACGVPAVASDRVPFAVEYLLGEGPKQVTTGDVSYREGAGAIVVPPDDVPSTAAALGRLLDDPEARADMGERAYRITIPRFTWSHAARSFLRETGIGLPRQGDDHG